MRQWVLIAPVCATLLALAATLPRPLAAAEPPSTKVCHHEPTSECTETHLGVAATKPSAAACDTRADCSPTEFCGAGVCRTLDGETGTMCIHRMWLQGRVCEPIDFVELDIQENGPDRYYPHLLRHVWTPDPGAECTVVQVDECVSVELDHLARNILKFRKVYAGDETHTHSTNEFLAGEQQVLDWLDAPCKSLSYQRGDGSGLSVMGEVSLWYP